MQLLEQLDKPMSFNVGLRKLLLEDARCMLAWKKWMQCHHPTTLLIQFRPLILILILLLVHNNL